MLDRYPQMDVDITEQEDNETEAQRALDLEFADGVTFPTRLEFHNHTRAILESEQVPTMVWYSLHHEDIDVRGWFPAVIIARLSDPDSVLVVARRNDLTEEMPELLPPVIIPEASPLLADFNLDESADPEEVAANIFSSNADYHLLRFFA